MYSDSHTHTRFSSDSLAPVEYMIKRAIELKMQYLSITDHQDFDFPGEEVMFSLNVDEYIKRLNFLKAKYKKDINLIIGVEIGLEPYLDKRIKEFVKLYDFDFVIGSSHLANRKDPYYPEFFEKRSKISALSEYFLATLNNLDYINDFDVYGHLDYVIRYAPNKDDGYYYKDYKDILDSILIKLINMGKGIEINTGAFQKGLNFTNPSVDIIRRYKELGGELLTLGSDSHSVDFLGNKLDYAGFLAKDAGFKHYNVFVARKPIYLDL